ncbi:MAG: energy transducer TonB [Marinifilaceae bacterium]
MKQHYLNLTKTSGAFIAVFLFVIVFQGCAEGNEKKEVNDAIAETINEKDSFIRCICEESPVILEYDSFLDYVQKNIRYPEKAKKLKLSGTVCMNFIVDKDGKVSEPKIIRGVHELLDVEAMRLINEMPDWIPGKYKDEPASFLMTMPISFKYNP